MGKNQETYNKFKEKNERAKKLLLELKKIVADGINLGVGIPRDIDVKLKHVISLVEAGSCLKVALIGGFSEGKTSIVAAWLGKYDTKSMKISVQESSDAVTVHRIDDELELIDTPGLFGFKEKTTELGHIEKYKEITRKYISEAHIVLYVMDPTNPIKESHKDELIWLFRTLNLLPRTVFVLNKFDEVADIEDDWEYREGLTIKEKNVIERLDSVIHLTSEEKADLQIVGISANPFGMGMDYWLNKLTEFCDISRIDMLREATSKVIDRNGGYFPILYEMQKSILQDVLINRLNVFDEEMSQIGEKVRDLRETGEKTKKNLERLKKDMEEARMGLREFFVRYFSGLAERVRSCEPEDLQSFIDAEVGADGCIINARIQAYIEKRTHQVNQNISYISDGFQADMNQFDSAVLMMGKAGLEFIGNNQIINNNNILMARDGIVGLGHIAGVDFGQILKFKPWGVVNFANALSGALAAAGVILKIYDIYSRQQKETEFNQSLEEMANSFREAQKQLLEKVNGNEFEPEFFPNFISLQKCVEALEAGISELEVEQSKLREWCDRGSMLAEKYYAL